MPFHMQSVEHLCSILHDFSWGVGVMSLEFRQDFWHRKARVSGLSYAVLNVILGLAILVQLRLVTDGQADKRTDTR